MKPIIIFISFFILSQIAQGQNIKQTIKLDLETCQSQVYVRGYKPKEFTTVDSISEPLKIKMESLFKSSFGPQMAQKVILTVGYKYNLDSLARFHSDEIKNYKWEIPEYYLNYALYDTASRLVYCMEFMISRNGEILKGFIPKIDEKYYSTQFISKEKAAYLIGRKGIDVDKLDQLELWEWGGKVIFDSKEGIFSWQFGSSDQIYVNAVPNGKVTVWKNPQKNWH